jgi:hypothetical protein
MLSFAGFFAILIYIGAILFLSGLFWFLPKYKNPFTYIVLSSTILELPFIIGLLFFNFNTSCATVSRLLYYMLCFHWGGSLFGFVYYYLFVRRKVK